MSITEYSMSANHQNIHCPVDVIAGHLITKDSRHQQHGQVAGGAGSRKPEDFQRAKIQEGTGISCPKTTTRINLRTNTLKEIAHPHKNADGFDYTEDFDGKQILGDKVVYINLKSIVGKGGAQTRSLKEVYHLVEGQLKLLTGDSNEKAFFANILDGDEAHAAMPKFTYLLARPEYSSVKDRIYVGDLKSYFDWFKTKFASGQ